MWGNISTESTFQTNFNVGFSNTTSDILIHLSLWQYWWWFWFAFVWSLYFLILLKVSRFRTLKFRPRIMSSLRPHGKWGDLLICLIPISWCINILINSNFLLKMIEWQSENSLFTIRIRGRQWYWVYKFDLKDFTDILSINKNVGHNKWFFSSYSNLDKMDDYLHTVNIRASNKWLTKYWDNQLYKQGKQDKLNLSSLVDNKFFFLNKDVKPTETFKILDNKITYYTTKFNFLLLNKKFNKFNKLNNLNNIMYNDSFTNIFFDNKLLKNKKFIFKKITINELNNFDISTNSFDNLILSNVNSNYVLFSDFNESLRWVKRSSGSVSPLRTIKLPLNNFIVDNLDNFVELFRFRFNDVNCVKHKNLPNTNYFTFKQKRYKFRNKVLDNVKYYRDQNTGNFTQNIKSKTQPFLLNNNVFTNDVKNDLSKTLRLLQKNKNHDELFSIPLYKRLLRTRRTLVLPAHVNITAITNSYDVVHSWFIPGLGLKFDCIPGRATHHSFYIDNVGFYYGQCAEICGRYHHHMPIKVCALPFDHFIIWWQSFGLNKLTFTNTQKKYNNYYTFRKFVW